VGVVVTLGALSLLALLIGGWSVVSLVGGGGARPAPGGEAVGEGAVGIDPPRAQRVIRSAAVDPIEAETTTATAESTWPDWATDDLSEVHLVAPEPGDLPFEGAEDLLDDPDKVHKAIQSALARELVDRLIEQERLGAAQAEDVRRQLEANLAAL